MAFFGLLCRLLHKEERGDKEEDDEDEEEDGLFLALFPLFFGTFFLAPVFVTFAFNCSGKGSDLEDEEADDEDREDEAEEEDEDDEEDEESAAETLGLHFFFLTTDSCC